MENIIFPLHIISLVYVAFNVFQADHMGFNWIRGKTPTLNRNLVSKYHKRTWLGLLAMTVTGIFLFMPNKAVLLAHPQFYIKMGFVLALFINSFVIGKLSKIAVHKSYVSLTAKEKISLFISGAVSTISWVGADVMALFILPE